MKNLIVILIAFAFQFFFGSVCSHANIKYKLIDTTIWATPEQKIVSYKLDINDDGINDFTFTHDINGYYACYIYGAAEPSSGEIQVDGNSTAYTCSDGEIISENPVDSENKYYGMGGLDFDWKGAADKSIAVRFKINSEYHYGWIRVNIPDNASNIYIIECAFESIPGNSIVSGSKITSVFDNPENEGITIESKNRCLIINTPNSSGERAAGNIYDINGNCIDSFNYSGNQTKIRLDNFKTGVYFLSIDMSGRHYTRKFVVVE
jgi:hypothetical protein